MAYRTLFGAWKKIVSLLKSRIVKYLFAFDSDEISRIFRRALKAEGIACEIRRAQEFSQANQGPELWVRDEDYEKAMEILIEHQREQ